MNLSIGLTDFQYLPSSQRSRVETYRIAHHLFERAHRRGVLRRFSAKLTGHSTSLHSLDLSPVDQQARRSTHIRNIPLDSIQGSEGRSNDFDNKFNPLRTHNQERWIGIVLARQAGIALPPVELIRCGDSYYVRDGHHRISVARALGQLEIDAIIVN